MKIRNFKLKILLFLIILLGAAFRLYGINFDETCCQHPDERAIIMYTIPIVFPGSLEEFLSPESPLNPHFFAYGNFPLYLLKIISSIASNINPELSSYGQINLVGRVISVIAEMFTILLIFLTARLIFNYRVGLLASFVYSISVLPIQYSHFFTSDILLTTFVTLTMFLTLRFYQRPSIKSALPVGIAFGLSLTTKISAIPLVVSLATSLFIDFLLVFLKTPHKVKHWFPHVPTFLKKLFTEGLIIVVAAFITFTIAQPYAIIDFKEFLAQNLLQSQMTHNAYIFPYTLQYVGKIPYIYEITNIFKFGLGPVISAFVVCGLLLVTLGFMKMAVDKKAQILIIAAFFFLYFAFVGNFAIGFMRYLLPVYPVLAILAAVGLNFVFEKIEIVAIKKPILALLLILLLIWPLSFISIYSRTNTRIEASNWIVQNIPQGKSIAVEHWDDRLPMGVAANYVVNELTLYDLPDDDNKWIVMNDKINQSEYIILASNRLYVPLQKLSDCQKFDKCYPKTAEYYRNLFSGNSGFEKIKEFSSYPTIPILGLPIVDDSADESFTVYDHPKILIFKRK